MRAVEGPAKNLDTSEVDHGPPLYMVLRAGAKGRRWEGGRKGGKGRAPADSAAPVSKTRQA